MDERFGRTIKFSLASDLDTTGCDVEFIIAGVSMVAGFNGQQATLNISAENTSKLNLGDTYAAIVLRAGNARRTVSNTIPVRVTDSVEDVDGSINEISVSIIGEYNKALEGIEFDEGASIGSLRRFLALVGAAMGAKVIQKEGTT